MLAWQHLLALAAQRAQRPGDLAAGLGWPDHRVHVAAFGGDVRVGQRVLVLGDQLGPALVEPVLDPDWGERGALLGSLDGRIVALANYARLRDRRVAEVAFTVADDHQGRGIGTRLLERLAEAAAAVGIGQFLAEVLPDNRSMLSVFRDAGFDIVRELNTRDKITVFLVEQNAFHALKLAHRGYVMVNGTITLTGTGAELLKRQDVQAAYLEGGRH